MFQTYVLIQNVSEVTIRVRLEGGADKVNIKAGGVEFCSTTKTSSVLGKEIVAVNPVDITAKMIEQAQKRLIEVSNVIAKAKKEKEDSRKADEAKAEADAPMRKELAEAKDKFNSGKFSDVQYQDAKKKITEKYSRVAKAKEDVKKA